MARNRHRVGRHLVRDDESGIVHYDDQVVKRWDGAIVKKSENETRHPQEFVKAKNDPKALKNVRPDVPYPAVDNTVKAYVGKSNVPAPIGPAHHLFDKEPGVGTAKIGSTFKIH